ARARLEAADLIEWPEAAGAKLTLLRALFERFSAAPGDLEADFARFDQEGGALLEEHARFEALHAVHGGHWRNWPAALRGPNGAAVRQFAAAHAPQVRFHKFLQWLCDRSLARTQQAARA